MVINTGIDSTIYNYTSEIFLDSGASEGYLNLDEVVAFETNFSLSNTDADDDRSQLALGYSSTIAQDSASFILTASAIVLAPTTEWENRFCVGNFFLRTQMAEGFDNRSIYASLQIGSEWVSNIPHVYSLETSSLVTVIPDADYVVFIGMLQSATGRVSFNPAGYPWIQVCENQIENLPVIQFTVSNSTDHSVAEILLDPTDYIADDGSCLVLVRGQSNPDDIPDSVLTIGENILRNINLSFSARNREIGFCDPLE